MIDTLDASEAYLDDVIVDIESYRENPWKIFGVDIDVDTPDEQVCEFVTGRIDFYNFHARTSFPLDTAWEVCGPDFHPWQATYAYDPTGISDNNFGSFTCESFSMSGNAFMDSYDSSSGPWGPANGGEDNSGAFGHLFSNGSVSLSGNATIRGNVSAGSIILNGNAVIEGDQVESGQTWDCPTDMVAELTDTIAGTNSNDTIGLTVRGRTPFPGGGLDFVVEQNDELHLGEGIYYVTSMNVRGRLSFGGKAIILCTGGASLGGTAEINPGGTPGDLAIYVTDGRIDVAGQATVFAHLFAVRDTITLGGSAELFGKVTAACVSMSGNSRLHFDTFDADRILQFSITSIYDQNGTVIGKKINVFSIPTHIFMYWELAVIDNGMIIRRNFGPDGTVSSIEMPLLGYGDYFNASHFDEFNAQYQKMIQQGKTNIWAVMLAFTYTDPDSGFVYSNRLNFHREFAHFYSVDSGQSNKYDQPWEWKDTVYVGHSGPIIINVHRYDMMKKQPCAGLQNYNCYWDRLDLMLDHAHKFGVVIEMNFFDWAMPHQAGGWQKSPFHPLNSYSPDNELPQYAILHDAFFQPVADQFWAGHEKPIAYGQQKFLVESVVQATAKYPNIFYVPMNEPNLDWSWNGTMTENPCILFHHEVRQWASAAWLATSDRRGSFIMGLNVYSDESYDTAHRDAVNAMFRGRYDSAAGIDYPGLNDYGSGADFRIISYHTPFWKLNVHCDQRIALHKVWHDGTFPRKACIIDTDGDGDECRGNLTVLRQWARAAYHHDSNEPYASFISKHPLNATQRDDKLFQIWMAFQEEFQ